MTILITNPNYDDTLGYLYYYTTKIKDSPEIQDKKVICLERPRLTKKEVSSVILKKSPSLIIINGHGSFTAIYGDKIGDTEEIIFKEGENHTLLNEKIVYARSCYAAASLGRECTKGNRCCFIGYELPFTFIINDEWVTNPAKDNTAKLCLEPSNELIKGLIKGNNCNEAAEKFNSLSRKSISNILKNKEKFPAAFQVVKSIWNNMSCQVVLGNGEMSYTE